MKCPRCQTENPSDSKFCKECATGLPGTEAPVSSPTKTLETAVEELSSGSTFAVRYQIVEELGKGGMGRVYRAIDKKLNEEVALKLIKPEIGADKKTLERFHNELRLARKISHRNVGRMYELMEEKGAHFITMEYVPGQDLRGLIRQTGQLTVGKAVSIARQICEGLAEAHRLGVVHRDLKPSNIIIDKEGNARIMDFGIARSLKAKGITGDGIMIGTPEYMAPEQVEGKEADQRSDIYSLGIVLYEMLTGTVPFEGDTPLSIAVKKKTERAPDPKNLNPQISEDLNRLILRCLEKDRDKRYQDVGGIMSDLSKIEQGIPAAEGAVLKRKSLTSKEITFKFSLRKLFVPALVFLVLIAIGVIMWRILPHREPVSEQPGKRSIAVLQFKDLSPEKGHEYLCEGIPETLINALNTIEDLRVPARSSAFSFKGDKIDFAEIGQKLNVETVLEGSVQVVGDNLRVTPRLVNVKDGYQIWSQIYNRKLADLFSIQDDIAQEIVKALKIKLLGEQEAQIVKHYTENTDAYNLYLKGRYFWNMRTGEGLNKAIEYFEQAIQKDPKYALAYTGLADSYTLLPWYGDWMPKEAYPKAKETVLKALELDDMLGEAHISLAAYHWYGDWDWAAAEKEFKRGIELSPRYPTGYQWYGGYMGDMGRFDEAVAELKKALDLDPLSLIINLNLGDYLFCARRLDEAIDQFKKTIEINPQFGPAYAVLGRAYLMKRMFKEAIKEFQKNNDPLLVYAYEASGNRAEALRIYEEWIKRSSQQRIEPVVMAFVYFGAGKTDLIFEALERGYQERHPRLLDFIKDPTIDGIRQDPRFKALLKKMNMPEFWLNPTIK